MYSSLVENHINTELGNMRLCEVTKLTVQGFVNGLVAKMGAVNS
ncbi:MAG: N-terminal phage integrase SAM-like domain-containing protein [Clostridiales bacterium]|nr:MAG: N-terminal phage integrase SAM-like domain-containing protein [Clostridiales bacterium]